MITALGEEPTSWNSSSLTPGEGVAALSQRLRRSTEPGLDPQEDTVPGCEASAEAEVNRRMLWVDGVGGYLLLTGDELTIGQPAGRSEESPEIALLADLSRRHATLARRDGRYLVTPIASTTVDDRSIDGPTVVASGSVIGLGSVRLELRRPHALSTSALLTIPSGHRTAPASDGILLMAESCVVGPKPHSHVRVPHAADEAILFRGAGGLRCRAGNGLLVDGNPVTGPAPIVPGKRFEGQDFAFCIEQAAEP